jgi:hypothetical protein
MRVCRLCLGKPRGEEILGGWWLVPFPSAVTGAVVLNAKPNNKKDRSIGRSALGTPVLEGASTPT